MKNVLNIILGLLVIGLLIWLIFFPREKIINQTIIEHRRDTIVKFDTIYQEKPVPIFIETEPDTVYIESLDTTAVMERETKTYQDSTYEVQISGIEAELDWIKTYPRTVYINTETTVETVKKQRFTHGFQAGIGYGIINKKADLYVGYGFQFNF